MEMITNYMKNTFLRHALNALTRQTFGFDFEAWVMNGYFEGDYIPYSFLENGKILSNASANKMQFIQNGVRKDYIQIGTVMTDIAYRKQGLAGKLVQQIIREYEGKCDGIYLFSDLGALDFYRKAGFQEGRQYQYEVKKGCMGAPKKDALFKSVSGQDGQMRQLYMDTLRNSAANASLEQSNKFGLQMFYTPDLSNTYYAEDIGCFAVMEQCEGTLTLQSVVSRERIPLKDVLSRIALEYHCLKLGFSPCAEDAPLFECHVFDGGYDYRLFYRGQELEIIEKEKLFFPLFSHA